MAGFQSAVFINAGLGVPGERYNDSPWRAQSFILNSASAAYNIIGQTMYTVSSQGVVAAGGDPTTRSFAGLLSNPKAYASYGTVSGGPLAPNMTLPNSIQAECSTMGTFVVYLPNTANVGDPVIYNTTTGAIASIALGASVPGGSAFAFAVVDVFTVTTTGGLAVITMTPQIPFPT